MKRREVVIIGAGASGLAAAIAAARRGAVVTVVEADVKPARKVLRTGNGRCNLSNTAIRTNNPGSWMPRYNDPAFVRPALEELDCAAIREAFQSLGLFTYEDAEGRVYPVTNRARSVVDVLLKECSQLGTRIVLETSIARIVADGDGRPAAVAGDGTIFRGDALVIACGCDADLPRGSGIPATEPQYVLGPVPTDPEWVRRMDGVRMRAALIVEARSGKTLFREKGEVLFRKKGVSGIVVFDASRFASPGDVLALDLLPWIDAGELTAEIERRLIGVDPLADADALFDGLLVREVAETLVSRASGRSHPQARDVVPSEVARLAKRYELVVAGTPPADGSQVSRGGIPTTCVDPLTFVIDGLHGVHACGESLDVDGACGGFNLHWAWASGILAGRAASGGTNVDDLCSVG